MYIAMDVRWGCLEGCVHRLGLFGGMQARRDRNQVKFLVKSDFTSNFTGFLIVLCSCEAIVKHVWRGRVHSHGCTLDVYIARDLSWGIALYK